MMVKLGRYTARSLGLGVAGSVLETVASTGWRPATATQNRWPIANQLAASQLIGLTSE
jgi:hypothetical protein